jgi:hypothetical protein
MIITKDNFFEIEIFIFAVALFTNHFYISTGVERVVDTIIGGIIVVVVMVTYMISYKRFRGKSIK